MTLFRLIRFAARGPAMGIIAVAPTRWIGPAKGQGLQRPSWTVALAKVGGVPLAARIELIKCK